MDIKVGNKYLFRSQCDCNYLMEVVNINHFRPPDESYACDVYMMPDKIPYPDAMFFGDEFFKAYKNQMERYTDEI